MHQACPCMHACMRGSILANVWRIQQSAWHAAHPTTPHPSASCSRHTAQIAQPPLLLACGAQTRLKTDIAEEKLQTLLLHKGQLRDTQIKPIGASTSASTLQGTVGVGGRSLLPCFDSPPSWPPILSPELPATPVIPRSPAVLVAEPAGYRSGGSLEKLDC